MMVFNPIEFDGRVKRAVESLNKNYLVILFCPAYDKTVNNDLTESIIINRSWLPWKKWSTSLSLFIFWFQSIILSIIIRPKIIYSHDFYLSLSGIIAAKLAGSKSVYDAHELIISEQGIKQSLRDRFFYWCERLSIGCYDLVVAANEERAKLMKDHYGLTAVPMSIRNVSKPTLGSVDSNQILKVYPKLQRAKDDLFIVYMGDINLDRGLFPVVQSLEHLPQNISLVVIGDGPDLENLNEYCRKKDPEGQRLRILGPIPQYWVQDALSLCDVGILVYSLKGLNNIYCSPNKIFEYTQAGLPVVSTAQPPLVNMIRKYGLGIIVGGIDYYASPKEYADAVMTVLDDKHTIKSKLPAFLSMNSALVEQGRLLDSIENLMIVDEGLDAK